MLLIERLLSHRVITARGCWQWDGGLTKNGYANIYIGRDPATGKKIKDYTHRISYKHYKGEIPAGKEPDHLCRNRACFNPDHLEAVTRSVNTRRGDLARVIRAKFAKQTECKNGHSFSGSNLYLRPTGGRACNACRDTAARKYQNKKRGHTPEELRNVAD